MNILQNEYLIVETKKSGAELTRIYSKKNNQDILWCGNNQYWGRRSPILFPIVGKLKDNKTIIDNKYYTIGQHGFARDMEFTIIESTDNSITYLLTSNDQTKIFYPYSFELIIKYILLENSVNIHWTVNNIDNKEINFSIGAHPAFNIPLDNDKSLSDYSLKFKAREQVEKISLNNSYYDNITPVNNLDTINLNPSLFSNDALIYTNIDEITIYNKSSKKITVEFKDFPLVGIWSPYYIENHSVAPFLCIEPWYGLADSINSDYNYKNKAYINTLKIGESFNTSYKIYVK